MPVHSKKHYNRPFELKVLLSYLSGESNHSEFTGSFKISSFKTMQKWDFQNNDCRNIKSSKTEGTVLITKVSR